MKSCTAGKIRYQESMFNVCHNCGLYRADKVIDPSGPYVICPECRHKHPFRMLRLLIVSGASGAWRRGSEQAYVDTHVQFNRWFKEQGNRNAPVSLLDTTNLSLETTIEQVKTWIVERAKI